MDTREAGRSRWAGKSVEEKREHALRMLAAKGARVVVCPNCKMEFAVGRGRRVNTVKSKESKPDGGRVVSEVGRAVDRDKATGEQPERLLPIIDGGASSRAVPEARPNPTRVIIEESVEAAKAATQRRYIEQMEKKGKR